MRPIKFRAWDKRNKRMFVVKSLIWSHIFLIEEEGVSQRHGSGETDLMQYTGLKDMNGKEIFESDIVLYEYKTNRVKRIIEVSWVSNNAGVGFNIRQSMHYRVIGNIYENPELLGGQNE